LGVFFSSFSRSTCLVGFLCAFWMVEVTHTHTHTQIGVELDRPTCYTTSFSIQTLCNHQFAGKKMMTFEVQSWPDLCFFPIVVSKGPCWSHTLGIDRSRKLQRDWFLWVKHLVTSASEFGSVGGALWPSSIALGQNLQWVLNFLPG
jgi:hypothetical protein